MLAIRCIPFTLVTCIVFLSCKSVPDDQMAFEGNVIPTQANITHTHPYSVSVSVTRPPGRLAVEVSGISEATLKASIVDSIRAYQVFNSVSSDDKARFQLHVTFTGAATGQYTFERDPSGQLYASSASVKMETIWHLTDVRFGGVDWKRTISKHAPRFIQGLNPTESALRENIKAGLEEISKLDL